MLHRREQANRVRRGPHPGSLLSPDSSWNLRSPSSVLNSFSFSSTRGLQAFANFPLSLLKVSPLVLPIPILCSLALFDSVFITFRPPSHLCVPPQPQTCTLQPKIKPNHQVLLSLRRKSIFIFPDDCFLHTNKLRPSCSFPRSRLGKENLNDSSNFLLYIDTGLVEARSELKDGMGISAAWSNSLAVYRLPSFGLLI